MFKLKDEKILTAVNELLATEGVDRLSQLDAPTRERILFEACAKKYEGRYLDDYAVEKSSDRRDHARKVDESNTGKNQAVYGFDVDPYTSEKAQGPLSEALDILTEDDFVPAKLELVVESIETVTTTINSTRKVMGILENLKFESVIKNDHRCETLLSDIKLVSKNIVGINESARDHLTVKMTDYKNYFIKMEKAYVGDIFVPNINRVIEE